ncbi:DUF1996 domain-containing protein [Streptomyces sp. NPDC051219]|uniref:DUF1996 domain-containing protein n=1 Tax=Streptomyces sp. NPDC051219 TaxID=3155283 RepID=UPI003416E0DA
MRQAMRRRPRAGRRVAAASIALILGGGGLITVNSYAAAGEGQGPWPGGESSQEQTLAGEPAAATVKCPEVANELPEVPEAARPEVDRELATMDSQITEAYQRFAEEKEQIARDPQFARNAILGPLQSKREAGLDRIAEAIGRVDGQLPEGLRALAPCTLLTDDADTEAGNGNGDQNQRDQNQRDQDQGDGQDGQDAGGGQAGGNGGQAGNGPQASDFTDIRSVQPNVTGPGRRKAGSAGTFTTDCGVNENGKFNPDNVIVAPGVSNGAHHMHDYVGNQANDAFATDDDLASGGTTCRDQGDRSTYYWPVLRLQNGQNAADADADGGGKDQNVGEIQTPSEVTLTFEGSPQGKVTAMPRFLRIITGDAKAFVNGDANANASWSCTGFEDRQLKNKYPICPEGSQVVRTFKFQSCWDGQSTDSANHRTHVAFADADGNCQNGFRAIPRLVQRIVYDVPPPVFDGENASVFAVDSFPEQLHKPITDHGDFINVFDEDLMDEMVDCINDGRRCGPDDPEDAPADGGQGPSEPGTEPTASGRPGTPDAEEPKPTAPGADGQQPTTAPATPGAGPGPDAADTYQPAEPAGPNVAETPQQARPTSGTPGAPATPGGRPSPEVLADATADAVPAGDDGATADPAGKPEATAGTNASAPSTGATAQDGEPNAPAANDGARPQDGQVAQGDLAATGAQLWPSAAGAVLVVTGIALLRRRTGREVTGRR